MSAVFSEDGRYRYRLDRTVDDPQDGPRAAQGVLFVALNPSKAGRLVGGKEISDPSANRMEGFTRRWGYGRFTICNLLGIVETDPKRLLGFAARGAAGLREAIGPGNDEHVRLAAAESARIVACWGSSYPPAFAGRARYMRHLLEQHGPVYNLGLTKAGDPRHPLYLLGTLAPTIWKGGLDD